MKPRPYMNPYLAGALLGLLLTATIYITGRGLGASGAFKSAVVAGVETVAPAHTASTTFYKEYAGDHAGNPLMNWLVFEVVGVLIGAFVSGVISDRMDLKLEFGPRSTAKDQDRGCARRGHCSGASVRSSGRGCTSGAALSGMAVMSTGGIITMLAIFAGAYIFAYFFRKLWI